MIPSFLRCDGAIFNIDLEAFSKETSTVVSHLTKSSPSAPPARANLGSFLNSGGKSSMSALGTYGGLLSKSGDASGNVLPYYDVIFLATNPFKHV